MDYSDQIQSRLFQIPREIRDMIYFFYFYEPNGLHHHLKGENGVLRTSDGKPLDIRFTRACKAVAKESQGLALKLNTITFTPDDRTGARPLGSDALRFKRLLNALDATKWQLLYNNADYLNPTQIQKLIEMYPRAGRDIVMTLHELKEAQGGHRDDWWARHEWYLREQKHVPDIQKALDMTLEFARTHQYFRMEDYGRGRPFIPHEDPIWSKQKWFRPDLPHAILQWRPNASMIPTESELCALKAYLNPTETCCFDSGNDVTAFAWFFSAASLAASFLESLQPTQRSFLRTIILDENEKAVYNPERHAEELIKFCQENAQMRVERRVGLWDHIFPSRWGADLRGDWWNCTYFFAIDLFVPIVEWITEAENLSALGMPSNSYTLTFKNCNDRHVWRLVRKMLAFQEAFNRQFQQRKEFTVPDLPLEGEYRHFRFPYPCHVPKTLPHTMKDILLGNSNIRLEHNLSTNSNTTKLLHRCEDWSLEEWVEEWCGLMFKHVKSFQGAWLASA
ncbi:hypothetical protein ACJQWK_01169 [Exserohilum turcicum]